MRTRRLALLAGAALLLLGAWRFGVLALVRDPAHLRELLLQIGPLGFLVYIAAFALIQPIAPVPGMMFSIAAGLVWPPPVAVVLALVGATLASVNGFWFARYLARDWVEQWIPDRLRKYDEQMARRGFVTVLALRLFFWTNQGLNAFCGLSRVPFSTHLAATFLAYIPVSIALTYLGEAAVTILWHQPIERWLAAAALIVVGVVVHLVQRARRRDLGVAR